MTLVFCIEICRRKDVVVFRTEFSRSLALPQSETNGRRRFVRDVLTATLFWGLPVIIIPANLVRQTAITDRGVPYPCYLVGSVSLIGVTQHIVRSCLVRPSR